LAALSEISGYVVKTKERFLSAQADNFAGAKLKGKGVGLLRSK